MKTTFDYCYSDTLEIVISMITQHGIRCRCDLITKVLFAFYLDRRGKKRLMRPLPTTQNRLQATSAPYVPILHEPRTGMGSWLGASRAGGPSRMLARPAAIRPLPEKPFINCLKVRILECLLLSVTRLSIPSRIKKEHLDHMLLCSSSVTSRGGEFSGSCFCSVKRGSLIGLLSVISSLCAAALLSSSLNLDRKAKLKIFSRKQLLEKANVALKKGAAK